jgi:hypothetical protein
MWREAKDRKGEDARDKSFVASHRVPAGAIKMPPANAMRGAERNSAGTKAYELAPPFNRCEQHRTRVTRLSADLQEGRASRRPARSAQPASPSSAVAGGDDGESSPAPVSLFEQRFQRLDICSLQEIRVETSGKAYFAHDFIAVRRKGDQVGLTSYCRRSRGSIRSGG